MIDSRMYSFDCRFLRSGASLCAAGLLRFLLATLPSFRVHGYFLFYCEVAVLVVQSCVMFLRSAAGAKQEKFYSDVSLSWGLVAVRRVELPSEAKP